MNKKRLHRKKTSPFRHMQRGQVLIIVVFAIVGLVAFVGLVVDTGLVFIGYGTLRRSVDSAALAAAAQYRKDPDPSKLAKAAVEFLVLNSVSDPGAEVFVCNPNPIYVDWYDASLCTLPYRRRLVKVNASTTVHLAFLPVIGIRTVTLHATATSEAASLDIVLVVDASESMTFGDVSNPSPQYGFQRDPSRCNRENEAGVASAAGDPSQCTPFKQIQTAARGFVEQLFPADGSNQYDRVAVIPFDRTVHADDAGYNAPYHFYDAVGVDPVVYRQRIINHIVDLRVFQGTGDGVLQGWGPLTPGSCLDSSGNRAFPGNDPCRNYVPNGDPYCFQADGVTPINLTDPTCFTEIPAPDPKWEYADTSIPPKHYDRAYLDFGCGDPAPSNKSTCGTTNTGTAMREAGLEFDPNAAGFRQESLWVVIFLTDGMANHSSSTSQPNGGNLYCPPGENNNGHWCQDSGAYSMFSRHCLTAGDDLYLNNSFLYNFCTGSASAPTYAGGGTVNAALYDADDYARDMTDFVALGQQALIYTIGFGSGMGHGDQSIPVGQPGAHSGQDWGEQLLKYAADVGDDGLANGTSANNYFYAPDSSALGDIFQKIADRIATRLAH